MTDLSSENVNERFHPWKIRMYRVHSGSSVYEERSVASMDDAASGFDTPRSAFATTNAAVSRTETAEARRPSRYRPNQEARRGTREHCSEIGIHPTRSESYNLMSGRRRGRSSEDPTGRDFSFDRPQQLVPEVGFRDNNRAYGYSEYDTFYSGPNVGNDVPRHFDERELYRGYGGWDADGRTDDYGIEQSFPTSERRYDNDHGYSYQDAGINFCDREYSRYRSPSRERSRTFCAGPSFEPNPGSKTFSGRFQDRTRPMSRSPEYAAHLRHSTMKLEKYDGTTSLDSFLAKYEVCASHNRWSNKECLAHLKCSLTGQAAQILWDMGSKEISNSVDLVKALKARYGTANQCALYRTQLRYRRRGKNETLCELVQDIRRLVVLAYPGPMTETTKSIAIDAFIEALGYAEFSLKVREREPSSLDSAYNIAMRLEAFYQNQVQSEKERRPPAVRSNKEDLDDGPNWKEFLKQFTELQNERWSGIVKDLTVLIGNSRDGRKSVNREHDNIWTADNQNYQQRRPTTRTVFNDNSQWKPGCFHCGQVGHFKRQCPQWKDVNAQFRSHENAPVKEATQAKNELQGQVSGAANNHIKGARGAYIQITLGKKSHWALLDTGGEVSIVPKTVIKDQNIFPSNQSLRAANGSSIKIIGEAVLPIQIGEKLFPLHCLVAKNVSEVILGLDWLNAHAGIWNFNDKTLSLKGEVISIKEMEEPDGRILQFAVTWPNVEKAQHKSSNRKSEPQWRDVC